MHGARNIPLETVGAAASSMPSDEPIVLICEAGAPRDDRERARSRGASNVSVLTGGMGAWQKAGFRRRGGRRRLAARAPGAARRGRVRARRLDPRARRSPWFFGIPIFFGAGLTFSGLTGWCGMGMLLAKMPWNRLAMATAAAPRRLRPAEDAPRRRWAAEGAPRADAPPNRAIAAASA